MVRLDILIASPRFTEPLRIGKHYQNSFRKIILILSLSSLLSCYTTGKWPESIEFATVLRGWSLISYPQRDNFVFPTDSAFRNFWRQWSQDTAFLLFPRINFNDSTLIAVLMGERPTSNYRTTIEDIWQFNDSISVFIREEFFEGYGLPVITYPHHLVTIAKTSLPIKFVYREKVD